MTSAQGTVGTEEYEKHANDSLPSVIKTTARLVPLQLNDELELAKLELRHKKTGLLKTGIFGVLALVFLAALCVAVIVAGIAGLGTVLPLWLAALIVCGGLLLLMAVSGLIAALKFKALTPLLPEQAWRGIRYDLGIAKEGRDFDPASLIPVELSKEELKAKKAAAKEAEAVAKAEREAKIAEHGPRATESELIERTEARRKHLLELRENLVEQADVKKQLNYFVDEAKGKAAQKFHQISESVQGPGLDAVQARWKPLLVFAVSGIACGVFLRKLFKK